MYCKGDTYAENDAVSLAWVNYRQAADLDEEDWEAITKADNAALLCRKKMASFLLESEGRVEYEVPSDGLCLYSAVCAHAYLEFRGRSIIRGSVLSPYQICQNICDSILYDPSKLQQLALDSGMDIGELRSELRNHRSTLEYQLNACDEVRILCV